LDVKELSREQNLLRLEVLIEQPDYRPKFEETLRDYRRKMNVPGFRAGQVPMALVKKQVGLAVLYQDVSRKALDEVREYLDTLNLATFGVPMLTDEDLETAPLGERDYRLTFDIGLLPELDFDFSKLPELKKYTVDITEADIDDLVETLRYKHGTDVPAEYVAIEGDYRVYATLDEVDDDGALVKNGLSVSLDFLTPYYQHLRPYLTEKKVGQWIPVTLEQFFNSEAQAMQVLEVSHFAYSQLKARPLKLSVTNLQAVLKATVDEHFMLEVTKDHELNDLGKFRDAIRESLLRTYDRIVDSRYSAELRKGMLDTFPFEFPVEHVERLLMARMEDVKTVLELHEKHPTFIIDFKLFILQEALKKQFPELEVTDADLEAQAYATVQQWMGVMGGNQVPVITELQTANAEEGAAELIGEEHVHVQAEHTDTPIYTHTPAHGEEGHVHGPDCNHDHDHLHDDAIDLSPIGDGLADNPAFVGDLVQRLLQDEKFLEQTNNTLTSQRLQAFLESKYHIAGTTVSKKVFDDLL
jgi:trigger factor